MPKLDDKGNPVYNREGHKVLMLVPAEEAVAAEQNRDPNRQLVAWGYVRVSTVKQALEGMSMDTQEEKIKKYYEWKLKEQGYLWGGFIRDPHVSTRIPFKERVGGKKLMRSLRRGDAVIVAKVDRGFRDPLDMLTTVNLWNKQKVGLHVLDINLDTTSELGMLLITVITAVARWERGMISTRWIEGLARLRSLGFWMGRRPPYGYKTIRVKHEKKIRLKLQLDPEARKLPSLCVELRMQGYDKRQIASILADRGVIGNDGRPLHWHQVQNMLRQELRCRKREAVAAQQAMAMAKEGDK